MAVKFDKKRKIYAGVLGLGLAALVVDRCFLERGPAPAAVSASASAPAGVSTLGAGDTAAASRPPAAPLGPGGNGAADSGSLASLAETLDTLAQQHGWQAETINDAFVPPDSWSTSPTATTQRAATAPMAAATASAPPAQDHAPTSPNGPRFVRDHHLTALMNGGGSGFAVVDGQTVRIGAVIDGFRLVEVRQRSTIWERGSERVELALEAGLGERSSAASGRGTGTH